MGYYTAFSLTATNENGYNDSELIAQIWEEMDDQDSSFCIALNEDGGSEEPTKWYDHEEDMRKISARHPGVLFALKGEGEEAGDIWIRYFKAGKSYLEQATATFAPFNPDKLS